MPLMKRIKTMILDRKWEIRFFYLSVHFRISIMSAKKTIEYIRKNRCSVARFGDGELNMIMTEKSIGFQKYNLELSERLKEVLLSNNDKLLLCLPHTLERFVGERSKARTFWTRFTVYNKPYIYQLLHDHGKRRYTFGDTQMTRPYMDYSSDKNARQVYPALKQLWEKEDLLIVEGSSTCMGVGNDLFSNSKSVKRIVCPAENCFSEYNAILDIVKRNYSGELVLIALGPTATVLAADLSKYGVWALDVGHLDVEYEWYRSGAKEKTVIDGKYVNEVIHGRTVSESVDETYVSQIIARIETKGE